jgi:hypothetical protein
MAIPKNELDKITCKCCGKMLSQFGLARQEIFCETCQKQVDDEKKTWGGVRNPGPGKTLGRPKKNNKKIKVSFSISPDADKKLNDLVCSMNNLTSKSQIIEYLLLKS